MIINVYAFWVTILLWSIFVHLAFRRLVTNEEGSLIDRRTGEVLFR